LPWRAALSAAAVDRGVQLPRAVDAEVLGVDFVDLDQRGVKARVL
jgi:hypothetical protein